MPLNLTQWVTLMRSEYLEAFTAHGGSAVKFAVLTGDVSPSDVSSRLEALATEKQMTFASVSARDTKVHLMDRLFFKIASQIDWYNLAATFLRQTLISGGLRVSDDREGLSIRSLSEVNELPAMAIKGTVEKLLWNGLYRDYAMSQEFRLAMIGLCRALLEPEMQPEVADAVVEWLTGELRLISRLKSALIYQRVNRHNARHLLVSLTHWLRLCGEQGLVLLLDMERYTEYGRFGDPSDGNYYSVPATLDAYEVLRQFIDGTDELEAAFIVITTRQEFLTDTRRGVQGYRALQWRIADDVHARGMENPLAPLVRVDASSERTR